MEVMERKDEQGNPMTPKQRLNHAIGWCSLTDCAVRDVKCGECFMKAGRATEYVKPKEDA